MEIKKQKLLRLDNNFIACLVAVANLYSTN